MSERLTPIAARVAARAVQRVAAVDLKPFWSQLAGKFVGDPQLAAASLTQTWQQEMGGGRWADASDLTVEAVPPRVQDVVVQGRRVSRVEGIAQYLLDLDKVLAPMLKKAAALPEATSAVGTMLVGVLHQDTDLRRMASRELGHWFYMDAAAAPRFRNPRFVLQEWAEKMPLVPQLRARGFQVLQFSARSAGGSGGIVSGAHFDVGVDLVQEPVRAPKMLQFLPPPD